VKAISISQPYASLILAGHKRFETRSWAPSPLLIGERIAIASTKSMQVEREDLAPDSAFRLVCERLGMPPILELPRGVMLGTVRIVEVLVMTQDMIQSMPVIERTLGWWWEGMIAWRLEDPEPFPEPLPVRGRQGIYDWTPEPQEAA
jgi:hypothetical protein